MPAISLSLIENLVGAVSEEERQDLVLHSPRLLSPQVQETLAADLKAQPPETQTRLAVGLKYVTELREALEARPEQYPIGAGPLEELWARVSQGEIKETYAEELARQLGVSDPFCPVYGRALTRFCARSAQQGNWRGALALHKLLQAAIETLPQTAEYRVLRHEASLDWIGIVTAALCQVPDGRLYRRARAEADRLVEQVRAAGDKEYEGQLLQSLGVLHLDPYTAGRSSANYRQDLYLWEQGFIREYREEIGHLSEEEWRMPAVEEALRLAEQYLRQAAAIRAGHMRGRSLKALIQALEWLELLEQPVDPAEVTDLCRQSLELLDPDLGPQHRLAVMATLSRYEAPIDPSEVDRTLAASLDEYIRRMGVEQTIDLVVQAVAVLEGSNPRHCLEILRRADSLFQHYGGESSRISQWMKQLHLLSRAFGPEIPDLSPEHGLAEAGQQLRERARAERWDIQTLGAGLINLAARSSKWNEEVNGLALLEEAKQVTPILTQDYREALAFLETILFLGMGVNGVEARKWDTAIEFYTRAIDGYLKLDLRERATDGLRRIADLASRSSPEVATQTVAGLAPVALRLETRLGESATSLLQQICKRTVAGMMGQQINPEVLFFLLQVAKGLRFATALYAGSRYTWQEDEHGLRLLEKIRELEDSLPPDSPLLTPSEGALLDKDTILTAYICPNDIQVGDAPAERLANLQLRYDSHLNERLLAVAPSQELLYLSTEDVRAALDDRTVLLDFYLGATQDGRIAVYLLAITREEVRASATVHNFPDAQVKMGDGERALPMTPIAVLVQSLRRNLAADPGARLVDREAGQSLEKDLRGFLGHFVEYLESLRATGKDHLCIVPHGPLHYYPFHLLGAVGTPLAEQWIVTYLPSLHLLTSRRGQPAARRFRKRTLTAIGLSFADDPRPGLPPIFQSLTETREIAGIFGTTPILEDQATEKSVLEALVNSRYVHLSTHGWLNVNAPAFQGLVLTPDAESDGRLHAHELLSLDLRGLELLTLSACETALGRFDTGDNLRGLPAGFLQAGVSTIVGTLWSVSADAAVVFFVTLYTCLKSDLGLLEAFAQAQKKTRDDFPRYRDWGPFYLIGDWLG
jgi:hypothetical protein